MSRLESFGMTELERCGYSVIVYVLLGMMKTWEEVSTTGVGGGVGNMEYFPQS